MMRFDEEWLKEENQTRFAFRYGVIAWGVPFGLLFSLLLVFSDDISNHPLLNKIGIVAGLTLIGGPFAGWFFGHIMWAFNRAKFAKMRRREEDRTRLENRIADLEEAVHENTETIKRLGHPNPDAREIDSDS